MEAWVIVAIIGIAYLVKKGRAAQAAVTTQPAVVLEQVPPGAPTDGLVSTAAPTAAAVPYIGVTTVGITSSLPGAQKPIAGESLPSDPFSQYLGCSGPGGNKMMGA